MKKVLILLTGILILILVSCEQTMFLQLPDENRKIVVNGILSPDFGLWLNLSESVSISQPNSSSFVPITDARIDYYDNNILIKSIENNNEGDYYETDFKPQTNTDYKMIVTAEGMPEASILVNIPTPVEIIDYDTTTILKNTYHYNDVTYYETDFYLDVSFKDPDTLGNYYMLGIYYWENNEYHALEVDTEDLNMNIYIKDGIEILAWNDENINGQTKEFSVNFNLYQYEGFQTRFLVYLYSIEKVYFKYLKSYSQNFTILNEEALLSESVQVYSNVNGGYGVLAGVSSSVVFFDYTF